MFLKPLSWKLASVQLPCLDGNLWLNKPWIFNSGLLWHTCLRNSYWQYLSQWKDMIVNHCHKPVFLLWYISGQQCQLMQTKLMEWQGLNLHHPSLEEKRQNWAFKSKQTEYEYSWFLIILKIYFFVSNSTSNIHLMYCPKRDSFVFLRVLMFYETKSRETSGLEGKQN